MRANSPETFWVRVSRPSAEACWEWTGHRDTHGYGRIAYIASRFGLAEDEKVVGVVIVAWGGSLR